MSEKTAENFIEALGKLESERDLDTIVGLFADDSRIGNVVTKESTDPKKFWETYRKSFDRVESKFKNKIFTENRAALEWTTTGTTSEGDEFEYEGVSILETENDEIRRFFAYFDPAKLGKQMA